MPLPKAPPHEESKDACCPQCGSLFHTESHHSRRGIAATADVGDEFPPGYDPAEADKLLGREL